jgi:hypothetical protein
MHTALDLFIVFGQTAQQDRASNQNENTKILIRDFLVEYFPQSDIVTYSLSDESNVSFGENSVSFGENSVSLRNSQSVRARMYLPNSNFTWAHFFEVIRRLKGYLEERQLSVTQAIMAPIDTLSNFGGVLDEFFYQINGAWIQPEEFVNTDGVTDLLNFIQSVNAKQVYEGWTVLPFSPYVVNDDFSDYESCSPNEIPQHFARQLNGSSKSTGAPVGLRIQMMTDSAITEAINSGENLGGENVILTTLLQMNDKLAFVNTYCEPLEDDVSLNLFSLSAMNLSVTDERSDTDIATLVRNGDIIISDIILGV